VIASVFNVKISRIQASIWRIWVATSIIIYSLIFEGGRFYPAIPLVITFTYKDQFCFSKPSKVILSKYISLLKYSVDGQRDDRRASVDTLSQMIGERGL
jgi:hypothetical protein